MDKYDEAELMKSAHAVEVTVTFTVLMGGPKSWVQVWHDNCDDMLANIEFDSVSFKEAPKNYFDPESDVPWS